VKVITQSNH